MSSSIAGVLALNGLFMLTGLCLLSALRGWRSWLDLLEHLGVALVLGLAAVCVTGTVVLSLGGSLSFWAIIVICAAFALPAAEVAILTRRRPVPCNLGAPPRLSWGNAAAFGLFVLTAALLVAFYRVARVSSFIGYDAFAFWIPKAKAIYFFGGLDEQLFRTLPAPSYPLLVPELQAIDFRFMRSADVPNLAFQSWLLLVGFVWASAAILRPMARAWLVWFFLALATVTPELDKRLLLGQADWTLDFFFVLAALFLIRWVQMRERWLLVGYGVMLAATFATKREGALLAACLVSGALVATARDWRRSWAPVLGVSVLAYAVNIPWRIWWTSRHLLPDSPDGGLGKLSVHLDRVWPSFKLVLQLLFSYDRWLFLVPIALAAAALTRRTSRAPALLYLVTALLCISGFVWILWSDPGLPLNTSNSATPIPRVVGSLVLLSTLVAPILIEPLLRRGPDAPGVQGSPVPSSGPSRST